MAVRRHLRRVPISLVEHARNVLNLAEADSAENNPSAKDIIISPVACALPNRAPGQPKLHGKINGIRIVAGTLLHRIYGRDETAEGFFCNYEVNPAYEKRFAETGLKISARGPDSEIRAVEAPAHRFFVATLFQPQLSSTADAPHPLVLAFARTAAEKSYRAGTAQGSQKG